MNRCAAATTLRTVDSVWSRQKNVICPTLKSGVKYRALGAGALLRRNLLVYGLGGIAVPFLGIKLIDLILVLLGLA